MKGGWWMVDGGWRNDLPLAQAVAAFPSYARLPVAFPLPSRQSLPPRDCLEGRGVARCGRSGGSSRTKRWLVADGAAARRGRSSGSSRTKQRLVGHERPRRMSQRKNISPSTILHPPFTIPPSSWRGLGGGPFLHDPPSSWRGLGGGPKSYSLSLLHRRW